ncbi:MAG: antitoxin Xre/MbcA/ParS toxin-binding domain-containing protein [Terracidiphilus sp.]|jgi:putative toxin-antitoxin system antitoxin component (TIGR02293 family)
MAQVQSVLADMETVTPSRSRSRYRAPVTRKGLQLKDLVSLAFEAHQGVAKADASQLFRRVAATSALPAGKLRAELIPDSSWKRAGQVLGPQASQTSARLGHILALAERVWGNETDATEWLNSPHSELRGMTPLSLLKTEAGGRAVEALLGALEFGFPV